MKIFLQINPITSLGIALSYIVFTFRQTIMITDPPTASGDNMGGAMCLIKSVLPETLTNF